MPQRKASKKRENITIRSLFLLKISSAIFSKRPQDVGNSINPNSKLGVPGCSVVQDRRAAAG